MSGGVIELFFGVGFKHFEVFVGSQNKLRLQDFVAFLERQSHQFTRRVMLLLRRKLFHKSQNTLLLLRFQAADFLQDFLFYCVHGKHLHRLRQYSNYTDKALNLAKAIHMHGEHKASYRLTIGMKTSFFSP